MIIVLFRRYKLLVLIGILILAFQIFLAYKSFNIPIYHSSISNDESIYQSQQQKQVNNINNDDEDIINSNVHSEDVAVRNEKSSNLLSELKFKPKCDIYNDKEVVSALQRSKTQECKEHIVDVACQVKTGLLYPAKLANTCPSGNYIANRSIGCFKDEKKNRLLSNYYSNFKETNSPKKCIQICLQSGFLFAGVQYSSECFCGNEEPAIKLKLPDSSCNMKCPAEPKSACGGYYTMNIYETGIASEKSYDAKFLKNPSIFKF
jgi:protein xylosyltransferase